MQAIGRETFPFLLKVAIVDDSMVVVDRLEMMLNDIQNIEVVGYARNVTSAKELISKKRPGVVILDIHLHEDAPASSGMNLLQYLKILYPKMVVIMLTNLAHAKYREKCMKLGADYFFDKSNEFDMVIDV